MTHIRFPLALFLALTVLPASADTATPNEWLDRMSTVVSSIDFEGTVIRRQNGQSEAIKVVRKIVDGVVHEKLVTQEGNGLEIIRTGNEVHCILPDRKSVLIEFWNDDSTLFSTLPGSELRFGSEYDLSLVREERVAGRTAMVLAVRPHDGYRYGHRIWLDTETAFPLRTELFSGDGALLEQLKFADVTFNSDIPAKALAPSVSLDGYTWYPEPARADVVEVETSWVSDDLPPGFRAVSATHETMAGADVAVTHIMLSDGLANVSVFIAETSDQPVNSRGVVGDASNSHSVETGDFLITAIGDVPAATVRRIANSMRQP
jgi:sigma-E factor negative regulatory protein RseB